MSISKLHVNDSGFVTGLQIGNCSIAVYEGKSYADFKSDFIVNAAKKSLSSKGTGINRIIHDAAGKEVEKACKKIKEIDKGIRCKTGQARITKAGKLSHTAIIHAVGPDLKKNKQKGKPSEKQAKQLQSAYKSSLALANSYCDSLQNKNTTDKFFKKIDAKHTKKLLEHCKDKKGASITFPCISTGSYSYPANEAAKIAIKTIAKYLDEHQHSSIKRVNILCTKDAKDLAHLKTRIDEIVKAKKIK